MPWNWKFANRFSVRTVAALTRSTTGCSTTHPKKELEVRACIERMQQKNATGNDDFKLVVFDLYDYIIDTLEKEGFLDQCYRFEDRRGIDRIVKAVGNLLCVNDDDSLIVRHIEENTPENAIVFLTGIGKCYPLLRSHKVLNNLSQSLWPRAGGAVLPRHV